MNLEARLGKILEDAIANGQDMILLGNLNDFSEDEMKIIYTFKVKVSNNQIYLLAASRPHQYMVSLIDKTFSKRSKPEVSISFLPDIDFTIYGKFSCGAVKVKRPDCVVELESPPYYTPVVAEVAFRNEELQELIVETAELLSEFTSFQYCASFKIHRRRFFPAHFYVFERTIDGGKKLEEMDQKSISELKHECIEENVAVNEDLFARLGIRLKFHHEITEDNYMNDFSFDLEGRYFDVSEDVVTFIVPGQSVVRIKQEFDQHIIRFPR